MTPDQIRQWCMQAPRPALVRVTDADGGVHEVICGQTPWTRVGESIDVLRPDLIEAINDKGQCLRACRPNDVSETWSLADDHRPPPRGQRASNGNEISITDLDPESKRLALVAQLIANAYRHSTDVAFERLSELFDTLNRRAEGVDRTREQMYRAHVRQLEEQLRSSGQEPVEAPNGQELLGQMMMGLLSGVQMGSQPPGDPSPPSNGKGHPS